MVKIAPSILAADSANLGLEITKLQKAHADIIHFDVMDGHFVPNMTFGPNILKALKSHSSLPFDVHLMVCEPERFVPWFAEAGADILTFHLEATKNPEALIELIHQYNIKAGVSLKPDTDINLLESVKSIIDLVLVMAVEPGFGGQPFRNDTIERIEKTRRIVNTSSVLIEVDGGITSDTAPLCINAGADILVAGTTIFSNNKYALNIKRLKGE